MCNPKLRLIGISAAAEFARAVAEKRTRLLRFFAKISVGQGEVIARDIFSCGGRHERELAVRRRVRAAMVEELAPA